MIRDDEQILALPIDLRRQVGHREWDLGDLPGQPSRAERAFGGVHWSGANDTELPAESVGRIEETYAASSGLRSEAEMNSSGRPESVTCC